MSRWPTGPFTPRRTSYYGAPRFTPSDGACGVSGYPCVHRGVDLFASSSDVFSPAAGEVVAVSDGTSAPWRGYGPGVVVIRADSGAFLLLGHLNPSTISVRTGQRVAEGEKIANFDHGIAHTHFEVRKELTGPSATNTIDPSSWVGGPLRTFVTLALLGFVAWGSWRLLNDELI